MSSKTSNAEEKKNSSENADGPLLDKTAITLIAKGKEQGHITVDELNAALPSEHSPSRSRTMTNLNEMGINVVENEEGDDNESNDDAEADLAGNISEDDVGRTDDPCACIFAKWVVSSCCRAKAKSPLPSVSGWP